MHWLLILALLSSTTSLQGGGSASSLNRMAEESLRRQLGGANSIKVLVAPGRSGSGSGSGSDLDSFTVSLDGFSLDNMAAPDAAPGAAPNAEPGSTRSDESGSNSQGGDVYPEDDSGYGGYGGYGLPRYDPTRRGLSSGDIGDILGGIGIGRGGKYGDVLGDVLNGARSGGRIGRIRLRATNFSFGGARYNSLSADLGEVKFNWKKALRGQVDVESIAPGTLSLSLGADQLARLLSPRLPSLSNVKVRFASGRAFVGARSDVYGVRLPFEVGARLSVQRNRVLATDFAASVARLRLPGVVLDELTRGVNPLYDFDPQNRWPLAINLTTAQAQGGTLAMRGGIQWLGLNRGGGDNANRHPDEAGSDESRRNRKSSGARRPEDILGDILGR